MMRNSIVTEAAHRSVPPVRAALTGLVMVALGISVAAAQTPPLATPNPASTASPAVATSPATPPSVIQGAPRAAPQTGSPAPKAAASSSTPVPAPRPARRAMDRVELEASQITGNRELPRVLYIVPWRQPQPGELEGRPVNSLLYELTRPVDRDVFRRENRYYEAVTAAPPTPVRDTSQPSSQRGN